MSDSARPNGLQPARLLCPWSPPGKNPGVGSHVLLQGIFPTRVGSWSPTLQAEALPSEPPAGGGGSAPEGAQRRGQDLPPLCLRLNPLSPGSHSGPPGFQPRAGAWVLASRPLSPLSISQPLFCWPPGPLSSLPISQPPFPTVTKPWATPASWKGFSAASPTEQTISTKVLLGALAGMGPVFWFDPKRFHQFFFKFHTFVQGGGHRGKKQERVKCY